MNNEWFERCALFLEKKINDEPNNVEFVKAYVSLIKQKTKFDIACFSQTKNAQENCNNSELINKTQQVAPVEIAEIPIVPNPQWGS